MPERGKPFVVCKRRTGSFTVRPRGLAGWLQTAAWLALLAPLLVWFADYARPGARGDDFPLALFLFCVGILAWLVAGLWWLFAHAEVNDLTVVVRDQQRAQRKRDRRG